MQEPRGIASQREFGHNDKFVSVLFAGMVVLLCAWVVSLPLFPTQDGPMHKYYVHVLGSLLSGSPDYHGYAIRHPFPPYATHYAALLALTRIFSYDWSEKVLVCLIIVCTAYGVRYCARSMGPSGSLLSLCAVPLALHWSLVMGFLNYSLAVGLFFLAAGLWCRAAEGRSRLWPLFALVCLLLAVTHPVPLLLLIAFAGLDLLIRLMQGFALAKIAGEPRFSLKHYRWLLGALLIAGLCLLYPLASVDRSRSVSNLRGFGMHMDTLVSSLALFGVSPFDTRSRNLLINGYRLGLVALLLAGIALAAVGIARRRRLHQLRPADSMALLSIALLLAIPILPSAMNGSDFFAQRLIILPWLGVLAAASGYASPRQLERAVPVFAIYLLLAALVPAEIFFRPVARELSILEQQSLPEHGEGLAMLDPAMLREVRVKHELGFNPYLWSGALPFLHANAVMLNSPFMDQKITPLMPARGGDLLIDRMSSPDESERLINGNVNLQALPPSIRSSLLASSAFIVFVGTPAHVAQGLTAVAGATAPFDCTGHTWYLVCLSSKSGSLPQ